MSASNHNHSNEHAPLNNLDEWEDDVLQRYSDPGSISPGETTVKYGVT